MKKIFVFAISAMVLCCCQCRHNETSKDIHEFDARIGIWYNYSSVDWKQLDTLYYRPYTGDWPEEYDACKDSSHRIDPITEIDVHFWHLLQNARTKFHQDNLHLRQCGNQRVIRALNQTEAAFDTVFVHYMKDEYYLRARVDAYQEIMPKAIDKLVVVLDNCK